VIEQEFGPLKARWQFSFERILNDSGAGKTDQCVWFGNIYVADEGRTCSHSSSRWMHAQTQEKKIGLTKMRSRGYPLSHLHQTQYAFLHPSTPGGMQQKHWQALIARRLEKHGDPFTHHAAHAPTHESKYESSKRNIHPVYTRSADFDRFVRIAARSCTRNPVRILLSVVEAERIAGAKGRGPAFEMPAVQQ